MFVRHCQLGREWFEAICVRVSKADNDMAISYAMVAHRGYQ